MFYLINSFQNLSSLLLPTRLPLSLPPLPSFTLTLPFVDTSARRRRSESQCSSVRSKWHTVLKARLPRNSAAVEQNKVTRMGAVRIKIGCPVWVSESTQPQRV